MSVELLHAVRDAIAEVNEFLPPEMALGEAVDAPLAARLDSLGTVNLLLATESQVSQRLGRTVSLIDILETTGEASPLVTVGSFVAFLEHRLEQDDA
jgi:hypothetical protein